MAHLRNYMPVPFPVGPNWDTKAENHSALFDVNGDVSGKGVPAALYSAFAGELVRSRTFRRRYVADRSGPATVLASMNTILYERQLEEYYCTLVYSVFDFKRRTLTLANAGLPYPIRKRWSDLTGGEPAAQIVLPGVPLGSFSGSNYDEVVLDIKPGDLFVFFSDGVTEAVDSLLREFGVERLLKVIDQVHERSAAQIVDAVFTAVGEFRGDMAPNDDTTVVVAKITG